MPLTITPSGESLNIRDDITYRYVVNWRDCHEAGGEVIPEEGEGTHYSPEIVLSLVLVFLAPIQVSDLNETRMALIPPVSHPSKTKARFNQEILATALSSLMTLAKPPTELNTPAYTKRWKAALASLGLTDLIPASSWSGLHGLATMFHQVVTGQDQLRKEIVDRVLTIHKTGAEAAIISQVKLVWEFSSLKAVQYMVVFLTSHCRALEIPSVLDQAIALKTKWEEAKASDPNLAFSRVRDPSSHSNLNQANFPDLYYAAIAYAKLHKLVGENFIVSTSHQATCTLLIDRYVRRMAETSLGELSEETKTKLATLGYPIPSTSRRRPRTRDSEDELELRRPRLR